MGNTLLLGRSLCKGTTGPLAFLLLGVGFDSESSSTLRLALEPDDSSVLSRSSFGSVAFRLEAFALVEPDTIENLGRGELKRTEVDDEAKGVPLR